MNCAVIFGHLEVVKWLHENRTEGCTVEAMNRAAEYGHLEIVKWLHENRTEGCTKSAMDDAAKYGHLKVVKWLHENRTEGCTTYAMNDAARCGHLEVVKFLISIDAPMSDQFKQNNRQLIRKVTLKKGFELLCLFEIGTTRDDSTRAREPRPDGSFRQRAPLFQQFGDPNIITHHILPYL
jgi:hypothetical protein